MPKVEMQRMLPVPPVPAREALGQILRDIETGSREWHDFALHLNLGALGLPDVGYVAVPIQLKIAGEEFEPRHLVRFTIHSRKSPEAFPAFTGAIGVDGSGPSNSESWLAGEYELPMRGLGMFFDKVVARNAAEKTLENMLADLTEAVAARVEKRELSLARYRMFGSGD